MDGSRFRVVVKQKHGSHRFGEPGGNARLGRNRREPCGRERDYLRRGEQS
jgi:hypothetical protein